MGNPGTFSHTPADLRGIVVLKSGESHQGELQRRKLPDLFSVQACELAEGQTQVCMALILYLLCQSFGFIVSA